MSAKNVIPAAAMPSKEQIVYAKLLVVGVWIGILLLLVTYTLYVAGIVEPHTSMEDVTKHWNKGVSEYLAITDSPQGWGWTSLLSKSDYMNFVGLTLLASVSVFCYFTLLPNFWRTKNRILFTICTLEILVLSIAASGLTGSGGH